MRAVQDRHTAPVEPTPRRRAPTPSAGAARRGWDPGRLPKWAPSRLPYLTIGTRFALSIVAGCGWAALSLWLSLRWINDLATVFTWPVAIAIVVGIAIVPGFLNMQLLTALVLDRPRPLEGVPVRYPSLALLIAAYNEQSSIADTVRRALDQDYPGPLEVIVIDDGSEDATPEIVRHLSHQDPRVRLVRAKHGGKAKALNTGLSTTRARLVASIDADTALMPQSLRRITARLLISPPDTVAVAGSVLVRNSRENLMTRMQDWDYLLGIASVKRQQSLVRGTLVAQGAFSVYEGESLRAAGGWPDMIGEDIVLTWSLIENSGRVAYEPTAVAYTFAPDTLSAFARQRRRWARGMIEGLREHGARLVRHARLYSFAVAVNWGFPYLDFVFTFFWLPGFVLALTGNFMIVGPMTLAVLPLNLAISAGMFVRQRAALHEVGLRTRRNRTGLFAYLFLYQAMMAPISVSGYLYELFGARRRW